MLTTITENRNGVLKNYTFGHTPDNKSRIIIDDVAPDPTFNLPVRTRPKRMIVDFGEMGEVQKIQTTWKRSFLAGNLEIPGTGNEEYMVTNAADLSGFVQNLGAYIIPPIINGHVKAIQGYNNLPLFDVYGQVITYTEAEIMVPPSNDYHGAPISNASPNPVNP